MKPASLALLAIPAALLAAVVGGSAAHSGFVPAVNVRSAAPVLAIVAGAAYAHAVARVRAARDEAVQADPAGRAWFLGAAMLLVAGLGWLAFAQALPALATAALGTPRVVAATVVRKVPVDAASATCAHRLELSSDAMDRVVDQCVPAAVWDGVAAGDRVQADAVASPLGLEIMAVRR